MIRVCPLILGPLSGQLSKLLHYPAQPLQLVFVRGIHQRQIQPGGGFHHAFLMGESFETAEAVVGADAAFSHTAEGYVGVGEMQYALVDATPTEL